MLFTKWESTSLTDLHQNMQCKIGMILIRKKTTFSMHFRTVQFQMTYSFFMI